MNVALILAAVVAAAGTQTLPAAHGSLQQTFDAASDAADNGRCADAIALFESIETDPRVKPGSVSAGAIALRKGVCLAKESKAEAAEIAIAKGLAIVEKGGSSFDEDVIAGWEALGNLALARYDYARATEAFHHALTRAAGTRRLPLLASLARSTAFDGGQAALAASEEGLAIAGAQAKPDKLTLGTFHALHARALLNQGRSTEAYAELKTVLSLNGGLTAAKVSLQEVATRGDLAMAALQVGRKDDARTYLAYTGAGRISESPFLSALKMDPPLCGAETGLRPEDVAVVEFSLGDDGTVMSAQTIYSRGNAQVAAAFAKAVRKWEWLPDRAAKVPLFYRALTRVEVRCSNAIGSGPGLFGPLNRRFLDWAGPFLAAEHLRADSTLKEYTDKLAPATRLRGNARLAVLGLLAGANLETGDVAVARADEALALSVSDGVPPEVVTYLRVARARGAGVDAQNALSNRRLREGMLALLADPGLAADALAADTALLIATRAGRERERGSADWLAQLTRVAEDQRLPTNHPLRQLAWLELADGAAGAGDLAKAREYFARSGLSSEQCSLLGVTPALRRTGVSSDDYPMEAGRMGFEGWVRLEFDIAANGQTANARALVAYPPFVFVDAATGISRNIRYRTSYRPEGDQACSANRETITFAIPSQH